MSEQMRYTNQLDPPEMASRSAASEVLRVWAEPDHPQQLSLRTTWPDPAAWGLLLADIARHAAKAYAADGQNETSALERILQGFAAECAAPTDEPLNIS